MLGEFKTGRNLDQNDHNAGFVLLLEVLEKLRNIILDLGHLKSSLKEEFLVKEFLFRIITII